MKNLKILLNRNKKYGEYIMNKEMFEKHLKKSTLNSFCYKFEIYTNYRLNQYDYLAYRLYLRGFSYEEIIFFLQRGIK